MRRKRFVGILGILSIAILAAVLPRAAAETHPSITDDKSNNRLVFTSGPLTGEFEGTVPHVRFYATSDMARAVYTVNFRALVEYLPGSSGEGEYHSPQMLARATLDSGTWTHTDFYAIKDGNDVTVGVGFNLTLNSPIQIETRSGGGMETLQSGSVAFAVKAYNSTRTFNVNGRDITVNTAEIKIDVIISSWPFQPQSPQPTKLALEVMLHSDYNHFGVDEESGSHEVDASKTEDSSVTEHEFHETGDQEQNVRFTSGILTTSSNTGFFRFVKTATVTPPSGSSYSVNVVAAYKGESEHEDSGIENFFKLYLSYPYFQGTLVHDPSIGVTGGSIPTLYLVAGGAGVAGLLTVLAIKVRHPRLEQEPSRK